MLTLKYGGFTMKSVNITGNVERQVEIMKVVSPNVLFLHSRYVSKLTNDLENIQTNTIIFIIYIYIL